MTVTDSTLLADGYCVTTRHREPELPRGLSAVHQRLCIRFAGDTSVIYIGIHPGKVKAKFDEDFRAIIAGAQITKR